MIMDEVCWCTHPATDHDAGECWATVDQPAAKVSGQCACGWWEPVAPTNAEETAAITGGAPTSNAHAVAVEAVADALRHLDHPNATAEEAAGCAVWALLERPEVLARLAGGAQ